ncbi:MAG: hypothetical protein VB079_00555 [Petrimonas sp.]|nr:hypothetical protein [Petrimonas sp.]MEA5080303.1 hypothetical protein [Dysgonamonadaceae bacterium]
MNKNNLDKYKDILFSFINRDEVYPAVIRSKGFSFKGFIQILFKEIINEIKESRKKNNDLFFEKIWIYAESTNQYNALEILNKLPNSIFISNSNKIVLEKGIHSLPQKNRLKWRLKRIKYISDYKLIFRERFKDHYITIFRHDAIYETLLDTLKYYRPKAIIMSNDHNAYCRALLVSGKDLSIPTIYIQHAAVTNQFPQLKFDLSLLEGMDSLNKYQECGTIKGKVKLIGMPKFDLYYNSINNRNKISTFGFAFNPSDNYNDFYELSRIIHSNYPQCKIIFRYHPSTDLKLIEIPDYVCISNAREETSFKFLNKCDVIFAGNSSIHLEATLLNVISLYIDFHSQNINDYYGFISNNLINIVSVDNILSVLDKYMVNKPYIRNKAKYYVETINTEWDGRSTDLVIQTIINYLE